MLFSPSLKKYSPLSLSLTKKHSTRLPLPISLHRPLRPPPPPPSLTGGSPPPLSLSLPPNSSTHLSLSLSLSQKKNSFIRLSLSDSLTSLSCSQQPYPSLPPPKIAPPSLPLLDLRLSPCLSLSLSQKYNPSFSLSKKRQPLSPSPVSSLRHRLPLPSPRSAPAANPLSCLPALANISLSPSPRPPTAEPPPPPPSPTSGRRPPSLPLSLSEIHQLPLPLSPHLAPPNAEPPPPPLSQPSSSNRPLLPISSSPRSSRPPP